MGKRQQMTRQSKTAPFYKQPWFVGITSLLAVVATVVGIWRLMFPAHPPPPPPPPPAVYENIELVIDGSSGMDQLFDGTTKLKAAAEAVRLVLHREGLERENLALRVFGGACDAAATEPTLRFSTQNEGPITDAVQALKAQGEAPLVRAVLQAITDFGDLARFKDKSKRIIVITGTATGENKKDGCGMPAESIRQKLNRQDPNSKPIEFSFHFIGVGLDDAGKSYLGSFAGQIGGKADFADNRQQLQDLLSSVVASDNPQQPKDVPGSVAERESVSQEAKAVIENLNSSTNSLSTVIGDLNRADYGAAERDLEQARIVFRKSASAFEELGKRQTSDQYRRIYEAARNNRKILEQMISLTETMSSQARANNLGDYSASVKEFERLRVDYNTRIEDLNRQLKQLGSTGH
jgi:ribosomal protein L22